MKSCEVEQVDYLIVGSGVAAMRCALSLADAGRVLIITKQSAPPKPSKYANGSIAIASSDEEEIRLHYDDTLCAGEGLCNPKALKILVEEGPRYIEELISWGAEFEPDASKIITPKEGAKRRPYTFRARGNATTQEILNTLHKRISASANIQILPGTAAADLIVKNDAVVGVHYDRLKNGQRHTVHAKAVFIATGGMGQLYPETTNSDFATGDGLAIAYRAGAELTDMEFIQFHPTVLYLKNAPRILLPATLRAEGAYLRNVDLQRFLHRYHNQGELAPRDAVSRAILMEMTKTASSYVYLDCTHLEAELLKKRFPTLFETFLQFNIDMTEHMIPIHPAAHYCIGGIKIDTSGRTSLPGLYAAGEVSCSGVHGSNRLPSNSLLESLVFGARAGAAMQVDQVSAARSVGANGHPEKTDASTKDRSHSDEMTSNLKKLMWRHVGVVRLGQSLRQALGEIHSIEEEVENSGALKQQTCLWNLLSVAAMVTQSALAREESRGAHYRQDFPLRVDPRFLKHSIISKDSPVHFSN